MIYKKYELSQSLNGDRIVHIARNALGNVIFRAPSEQKLVKAIDDSIKEQRRLAEVSRKKKTSSKAAKLAAAAKPETEAPKTEEPLVAQAQTRRGPDGKFISKNQPTVEEPEKKSFWDRLS